MTPDQQWAKAAAMVLAELKRQGEVQERHDAKLNDIQKDITERLSDIQMQLVSGQAETRGSIKAVEQQVEHTISVIGVSPACKEHDKQLTKLAERVDQHASQHKEKFERVAANEAEIEKLHYGLASLDKDTSNTKTEWRTVVLVVGASALGSGAFWAAIAAMGGIK